jgi:hypothetical protein
MAATSIVTDFSAGTGSGRTVQAAYTVFRLISVFHEKEDPMKIRLTIGGAVTLAVSWMASVSIGAQGGRATAPDACTLMTREDAAAALGGSAGSPQPSKAGRSMMPNTTASGCEYTGSGVSHVRLNLWHSTGDTAQFRQIYQMASQGKSRDGLAGIGDAAWWYSDKHEEVQVLKGGNFFSIELRGPGNPTQAIKTVAQRVASRLP